MKDIPCRETLAKGIHDHRAGRITRRTLLKLLAAGGMAGAGATLWRNRSLSGRGPFLAPIDEPGPDSAMIPGTDAHHFLKDISKGFSGKKIRIVTEDTPPSRATYQLVQKEFTALTGIEVEWELLPLDQVLAKVLSDTTRQAGALDIFYLDQSWIGRLADDCDSPSRWLARQDLAYPKYDFDDILPPLVQHMASYSNSLLAIPYDIPIYITMYRQDLFNQLGLNPPSTLAEWMSVCQMITGELAPKVFGSTAQWKVGHYALVCNTASWLWAHGGSIFGSNGSPALQDDRAQETMEYMLKLSEFMPPGITNWDWHDESRSFANGQAAIHIAAGEFFPSYDDPAQSRIVGLAQTAPPPRPNSLRSPDACSFGETPGICRQGGSSLALSRHSRNAEAAWIFLQWATSADITVRASIMGGGASLIRKRTYSDPRITSRERIGPGTTRHLPATLDAIQHHMGTEPHFAGWEKLATQSFAVELGRMVTRQQSITKTLSNMAQATEQAVNA